VNLGNVATVCRLFRPTILGALHKIHILICAHLALQLMNILPERKMCRHFALSTLLAPIVRVLQIIKQKRVRYTYILNIVTVPRTNLYSKSKQGKKRRQSKVFRRRSENIIKKMWHSYYFAVCESGSSGSGQCLMTGFCEQNHRFHKCRIILWPVEQLSSFFNRCLSVPVDNYTIIVPTKCTSLLKAQDITIYSFLSLYS
jgi:hypothetical protein